LQLGCLIICEDVFRIIETAKQGLTRCCDSLFHYAAKLVDDFAFIVRVINGVGHIVENLLKQWPVRTVLKRILHFSQCVNLCLSLWHRQFSVELSGLDFINGLLLLCKIAINDMCNFVEMDTQQSRKLGIDVIVRLRDGIFRYEILLLSVRPAWCNACRQNCQGQSLSDAAMPQQRLPHLLQIAGKLSGVEDFFGTQVLALFRTQLPELVFVFHILSPFFREWGPCGPHSQRIVWKIRDTGPQRNP